MTGVGLCGRDFPQAVWKAQGACMYTATNEARCFDAHILCGEAQTNEHERHVGDQLLRHVVEHVKIPAVQNVIIQLRYGQPQLHFRLLALWNDVLTLS